MTFHSHFINSKYIPNPSSTRKWTIHLSSFEKKFAMSWATLIMNECDANHDGVVDVKEIKAEIEKIKGKYPLGNFFPFRLFVFVRKGRLG